MERYSRELAREGLVAVVVAGDLWKDIDSRKLFGTSTRDNSHLLSPRRKVRPERREAQHTTHFLFFFSLFFLFGPRNFLLAEEKRSWVLVHRLCLLLCLCVWYCDRINKLGCWPERVTNKKSQTMQNLAESGKFTEVRFRVKILSNLATGQKVCLVGSGPELGDWEHTAAIELSPNSENPLVWQCTANLRRDVEVHYKYFIKEGAVILKWETWKENRKVLPLGVQLFVDDGIFGVEKIDGETVNVWEEYGWLTSDIQVPPPPNKGTSIQLLIRQLDYFLTVTNNIGCQESTFSK